MGSDELREVLPTRIGDRVSISWREGREHRSAILGDFDFWGNGDFHLDFTDVTQVYDRREVRVSDCEDADFGTEAVIKQKDGVIAIEENGFNVLIHTKRD
jgi:hypothetical protein